MRKIYRTYRTLTEAEQKEKFGFCKTDLIKEQSWLSPQDSEIFQQGCLVAVDTEVNE